MMPSFNKEIRFDHLEGVELQDWDFLYLGAIESNASMEQQRRSVWMLANLWFSRLQLQHLRAQILDRPYPEHKARRTLIPHSNQNHKLVLKSLLTSFADQCWYV